MRKWEKYQPLIIEYVDSHKGCYVKEIMDALGVSYYIVDLVVKRNNLLVNYGLSPDVKKSRDNKIRDTLVRRHENGEIQFDYNEEWRQKVIQGQNEKFWSKPERVAAFFEHANEIKRERYGEHLELIQEKTRQTKLERYGDPTYNNKVQAQQTCLERYGHTGFYNYEKAKQTCEALYGGVGFASSELKQKYEDTMMSRYSVTHNFASVDGKLNGRDTQKQLYGAHLEEMRRRGEETRLREHGDRHWSNREQACQTMMERYGAPYYCMTDECRQLTTSPETQLKREETKRQNSTFNRSKMEDDYYEYLLSMYDASDVVRQYKESRYPYMCDFYIKSLDLFIECNFLWVHGPHKFDPNNDSDLELLNKWAALSKSHPMYNTAIYVWTNLDIRKFDTAVSNNLNFQTVYYEEWEAMKHVVV